MAGTGFWEKITALFGGGKKTAEPEIVNKKPRIKQVYETNPCPVPEFAAAAGEAELPKLLGQHIKCDFKPHIERQRIYLPGAQNTEGDLNIVYEGVSASCPPLKEHGAEVAKQEGLIQGYRYVDKYHVFRCCCDRPGLCKFYNLGMNEKERINAERGLPPPVRQK